MRRAWGISLLLCLFACSALAADEASIPPQLRDWQAWVLHGNEQHTCPVLSTLSSVDSDDAYQCAWPGHLNLVVNKTGGQFELDVHVDAESWIALPGSRDAWPQQVGIGKTPTTVLAHDGEPALRLAAGDYAIRGTLAWDERPPRLRVPAQIALLDLSVDGAAIAQPERNADELTLGQAAAHQREADALSVRVFRRVSDGAPPLLDTHIVLHVSGSAREQLLGPALPAGFVATALDGDLPARLESDGRLRVQLQPGDWTLDLGARAVAPLAKIVFKAPPAPWPRQEIWSYADTPALRTTRATGVPPIDPAQADVPDDWRSLPAFVMTNGTALTIEQRARGRDADAGDHVQLMRELWLDFDGGGLTADDHLLGKLGGADRLDVVAPWTLERAALYDQDDGQPLLVTRGAGANSSGVEVRTHDLNMHAGLRRDAHGGAQPANGGWLHTLDGVETTLHLPYGYRLLGAPGADRSPDSWFAQWNLLDLFVAAVIALLAGRLLGWRWALVAAGFIVLSQTEAGAPRWTLGLAVALALIARALPAGKLRAVARYAGVVMLALAVLCTLPFGAEQVRDALHPQLENASFAGQFLPAAYFQTPGSGASTPGATAEKAAVEPPPPPPAQPPPVQEVSAMPQPVTAPPAVATPPAQRSQTLQTIVVTGSNITAMDLVAGENYPANAIVQSGHGVPGWSNVGSSYRLGWSGPVTPDETYRLIILPAWATRILRVLMLGLLLAWLAALARAFDLPASMPRWPGRAVGSAAALLFFSLVPLHARAQDAMPSPDCSRNCAIACWKRRTACRSARHPRRRRLPHNPMQSLRSSKWMRARASRSRCRTWMRRPC